MNNIQEKGGLVDQRMGRYVLVKVGDQFFGVPICRAGEVLIPPKVTPVPLTNPEIIGLINVRNYLLALVDMRIYMGFPASQHLDFSRVITVRSNDIQAALLVDEVKEIIEFPLHQFEPLPEEVNPIWVQIALGFQRVGESSVIVFDIDRMLDIMSRRIVAV